MFQVWSVRSCEGSLKKRGHCLLVNGSDARALVAPAAISGKLCIRRVPTDQVTNQTQPRAVLRVANRGNVIDSTPAAHELQPFLQDIQNDVVRLSRAFVRLGRESNALMRAEVQTRNDNNTRSNQSAAVERTVAPPSHPVQMPPSRSMPPPSRPVPPPPVPPPVVPLPHIQENEQVHLSRNARRRMRQRVRAALNASQSPQERPTSASTQQAPPYQRPNAVGASQRPITSAPQRPSAPLAQRAVPATSTQRQNGPTANASILTFFSDFAIVQPATPQMQPSSGPSNGLPNNENRTRPSKKKRRHRR